MQKVILKLDIENEMDVVLSYRRAMQLAEFTGMPLPAQTKFATAVSEICRNVVEHVGRGNIEFLLSDVSDSKGRNCLEAVITDKGRGIANVEKFFSPEYLPGAGKGYGIFNSRKLVDSLQIESSAEKGTRVILQKKTPRNQPLVSNETVLTWNLGFESEKNISPYAELKRQNQQLIELLDQLKIRNTEVEQKMSEIQRLNDELERANFDVTELLRQREVSNNRLVTANKNLDAFAYTVSHDLKAPLRNLEGLASAIQESLKSDDTADALYCTSMLQQQVNKMDVFIAGILSAARIEVSELEKKSVHPTDFVNEIIRTIRVPEGFTIQVQPDMEQIMAEEVPLAQVFINLISNAINHHDMGKGLISISSNLQPEFIEFCISDDGPGVAQNMQEVIFNTFVSTPSGSASSTGLGLSIVKRIVENRGGKVWVNSNGRGSYFWFTWPLIPIARETAPQMLK